MGFTLENLLKHKEEVIKNITNICIEQGIEYIVTLAKKGTAIFELLCNDGYLYLPEKKRYVTVYIDRALNKKDNYEFLDKNILLFDDTMKSGYHFFSTEEHLAKKINFSKKNINFKKEKSPFFYYYCIAQCNNSNYFLKDKINQLYSYYEPPLDYEHYYQFCIDEAVYFQKNMRGNSIDLPIFEMDIDNVDDFKNILNNDNNYILYNERKCDIGNYKFNVGSIYLNDSTFVEMFKGFMIAPIAKVRYEYIEKDKNYKVMITPFALTGSININELKDLYNMLFNDTILMKDYNVKNENEKWLVYIKLYRYVNFLMSFYIGNNIAKFLSTYNYKLNYTNNASTHFSIKYDEFIKDIFVYQGYDIYDRLKGFKYTKQFQKSDLKNEPLSYDDANEYIFNLIVDRIIDQNKETFTDSSKYNFIEIEKIANLYETSKNNLITFCSALIDNIERYLVTNEIFLDGDIIKRGFLPGEISVTALPYDGRLFYNGLYAFYRRVNKDFDNFMRDYDLFIDKFYNLLISKNMFDTDYINIRSFNFFVKYFKNMKKNNFIECIEAKKYLLDNLDNAEEINEIKSIIDLLEAYLTSTDFKMNKGKV